MWKNRPRSTGCAGQPVLPTREVLSEDRGYADAAVAAVADPFEVPDDDAGDEGVLPSEPDEVPAGLAAGLLPASTDEDVARESVR